MHAEGEVWGVRCDVSSPEDVAALAAAARLRLGTVDRWVNNAASITRKVPLWETQPHELLRVTGTNVAGAFLCCREAVNLMREQPVRAPATRGGCECLDEA
jgi:chlorophyll(ide) b reductase